MASETQCDCGPRHRSARTADHAATAAICAASPGRKASIIEPAVAEFHLISETTIGNPKDTGSGAFSSHASAGAAIAHSKSLSYKDNKGKQPTTGTPSSHVRDYHDVDEPHTNRYSLDGFRAASSAVKESRGDRAGEWPADQLRTVGHSGALRAASGAFVSSRQRIESFPSRPPGGREATASAASAANVVNRPLAEDGTEPFEGLPAWADPSSIHRAANESARLDVSEAAYKLEGQNRKSVQRAAAVSLARDAHDPSKKREELPSLYGPSRPRSKRATISDPAALQRATLLQYAAQSRAAEAIAEMSDGITDYQRYYGTEPRPVRSRLSLRRRRPVSVGDTPLADAMRSREIQNQMSVLRTKLNEVDEQKQKDRNLLMEAARKNVDALIHDMEQRVYAETGRAPVSPQKELEEASVERPESETEAPTTEAQTDVGGDMIDVGGGQFIDPAVVEETARLRVRPMLDEIDEQVEKQRARELEERLDREEEQRRRDVERQRTADMRAEKRQTARPSIWPGLDRMHDRAEEKKAKKIEERLDRDEKKRQKTMESQREADTRSERQRLTEEEHGRKKRLPTRSKPAKESEPPAQRDTTAGAPDGRAEAEAEEGVLPEMVPSTGQGEGGVVAAAFVADGAAAKPRRSESRLKSWFRGRRAQRSAEVAQEPPKDTTGRESTPRPAAGTSSAADEARRAPLSSHPVTGDDLAQMQNGAVKPSASADQPPQLSVEESRPENVSRDSQEPAANGVATKGGNETGSAAQPEQRAPDNRHHDERHHHGAQHPALAEREDLRETAAEHGLAPPPTAGEAGSMTTARGSRFSEQFTEDS